MKARQIELDILSGNFDPSLSKYKPEPEIEPEIAPIPEVPALDEFG
jgi:hypothetical protein